MIIRVAVFFIIQERKTSVFERKKLCLNEDRYYRTVSIVVDKERDNRTVSIVVDIRIRKGVVHCR